MIHALKGIPLGIKMPIPVAKIIENKESQRLL